MARRMGPKQGRRKGRNLRGPGARRIGAESIASVREISCLSSKRWHPIRQRQTAVSQRSRRRPKIGSQRYRIVIRDVLGVSYCEFGGFYGAFAFFGEINMKFNIHHRPN